MNMTERQLKAAVMIFIGAFLLVATEPLAKTFADSAPPLVMATIYLLVPVTGLVLLVIGIHRASTKGK